MTHKPGDSFGDPVRRYLQAWLSFSRTHHRKL